MTHRAALLDYADDLLDGTVKLGPRAARTAALFARSAFEDWLDEQNRPWASPNGKRAPTATSKLIALRVQHGAEVGERAKRVWHALSRACHHHAYDLQPSPSEIRQLITEVRCLETL